MKKIIQILMFLCVLLVFASVGWSYSVGTTDVGDVDLLKAYAILDDSGDQTEVDWVNLVLGTTFTTNDLTKNVTNDGTGWQVTDENSNIFAFDFVTTAPAYYFIKVGAGTNDPPYTHYLFENVESFNWAVINLSLADGIEIKNIGKFSHIGELGDIPQVPEPATLLLLGFGLVGLASASRKLNK